MVLYNTRVAYKNMKCFRILLTAVVLISGTFNSWGQTISEKLKVNQLGYLPLEEKLAYVSDTVPLSFSTWFIKSAITDSVIYSSEFNGTAITDKASGEYVYMLPFQSLTIPGNYYLDIDGIGRSYNFTIADTVYNPVFRALMKSYYYQRSGVELTSQYAGKWARPAEYTNDAYIYTGYSGSTIQYGAHVNTAGGWRDAGDPNKKTVPACVAVYQLLKLQELFPDKFTGFYNNIPPDSDFPTMNDYLAETKVEIDWLLSMQRTDGAVWHSVAQANFFLTGMGNLDKNPRYLMPVSTTATADFAAAMCASYRVFKSIDTAYANKCLNAAMKAWIAVNDTAIWNNPVIKGANGKMKYPEAHGYSQDPPGINNTGAYTDTDDADERYWAAEELYITTGKQEYKTYFEKHLVSSMGYAASWISVANIANFSYALAFNVSANATDSTVKAAVQNFVTLFLGKLNETGFGICLAPTDYYWGSNGIVGQYAYSFLLAYKLFGEEKYKTAALSLLNYLLGANALNQTFISGVGKKPVSNIFHLPSKWDGVAEVVPGLLPGGPNQYPSADDVALSNLVKIRKNTPAKCYVDSKNSYSCNEPTIYDGAVWSFVAGFFYNPVQKTTSVGSHTENTIHIYPNPCSTELHITGCDLQEYQIISATGNVMLSGKVTNATIPIGILQNGAYILKINNRFNSNNIVFLKI